MTVAGTLSAIMVLFGKQLAFIFTDNESTALYVRSFLRILALGYIAVAANQTLTGIMRGAGDTLTPMWISMLQTIVIRVPLAYLFRAMSRTPELPTGDYRSIPFSMLIAWTVGMSITVFMFKKGKWRKNLPVANA